MNAPTGTRVRRGPWQVVVDAASDETAGAGHRAVGTEHLLLALVATGAGRAGTWLRAAGPGPDEVRREVRRRVDARGGDPQGSSPDELERLGLGRIPAPAGSSGPTSRRRARRVTDLAPETVAVLEGAREVARDRGRRAPIPDDVAIALVRTRGCRAQELLADLGIDGRALEVAAAAP